MKKARIAKISPIQKQVFAAIENYAKQVGADLVLDSEQPHAALQQPLRLNARSR